MYLSSILGSRVKVSILSVLFSSDFIVERRLAQKANSSYSEVNRQMPDLVRSGLISMRKVGKSNEYSLNKEHFLFLPLKALFTDINEIYNRAADDIINYITKKFKLTAIFLIGSVAEKKVSDVTSDIDLIFVCPKNKKEIQKELVSFINKEILNKYGFVCEPVVLTVEEYAQRLGKDPFITKVHVEGVLKYGKKPRRFV